MRRYVFLTEALNRQDSYLEDVREDTALQLPVNYEAYKERNRSLVLVSRLRRMKQNS